MKILILISFVVLAASEYETRHFQDEYDLIDIESDPNFREAVQREKSLLEKIIMGKIDQVANMPKKVPSWVSPKFFSSFFFKLNHVMFHLFQIFS